MGSGASEGVAAPSSSPRSGLAGPKLKRRRGQGLGLPSPPPSPPAPSGAASRSAFESVDGICGAKSPGDAAAQREELLRTPARVSGMPRKAALIKPPHPISDAGGAKQKVRAPM